MNGFFPVDDVAMRVVNAALEGVAQRQKVIAGNIANSATPNYRAKSVEFESSLAAAVRQGDLSKARVSVVDSGTPVKQDGNTVDVAKEFLEMDQSALMFEALVQALNFRVASVKAALAR